jgi:acyl-CoA synthetase (NDP forming)
LSSEESFELLAGYGVAAPRARLARSPEETARVLADIRPPVAVKAKSPDLLHKTDAGALRLGVVDAAEARRAFRGPSRGHPRA